MCTVMQKSWRFHVCDILLFFNFSFAYPFYSYLYYNFVSYYISILHCMQLQWCVIFIVYMLARYMLSSCVCLSVRLSVCLTSRYCIEITGQIELVFLLWRLLPPIPHCVIRQFG